MVKMEIWFSVNRGQWLCAWVYESYQVTEIKNKGRAKYLTLTFSDFVAMAIKYRLIHNCTAALRYCSYLIILNTSCQNHKVFNRAHGWPLSSHKWPRHKVLLTRKAVSVAVRCVDSRAHFPLKREAIEQLLCPGRATWSGRLNSCLFSFAFFPPPSC